MPIMRRTRLVQVHGNLLEVQELLDFEKNSLQFENIETNEKNENNKINSKSDDEKEEQTSQENKTKNEISV